MCKQKVGLTLKFCNFTKKQPIFSGVNDITIDVNLSKFNF